MHMHTHKISAINIEEFLYLDMDLPCKNTLHAVFIELHLQCNLQRTANQVGKEAI